MSDDPGPRPDRIPLRRGRPAARPGRRRARLRLGIAGVAVLAILGTAGYALRGAAQEDPAADPPPFTDAEGDFDCRAIFDRMSVAQMLDLRLDPNPGDRMTIPGERPKGARLCMAHYRTRDVGAEVSGIGVLTGPACGGTGVVDRRPGPSGWTLHRRETPPDPAGGVAGGMQFSAEYDGGERGCLLLARFLDRPGLDWDSPVLETDLGGYPFAEEVPMGLTVLELMTEIAEVAHDAGLD